MPDIPGYDVPEEGPPAGICGWCWRSTWSVGVSPFYGGVHMPAHVTCLMQMQVIRRRIISGWAITGRTVAERRYLRMVRVHKRRLGANVTALLGPGRFGMGLEYPDGPNEARERYEGLPAELGNGD